MTKIAFQKVRVSGYKKHYKVLMQELHRGGVLDICENSKLIEGSKGILDTHFGVFDLTRIDFAIRFLTPYLPPQSAVESILTGGKLILPEEEAKGRLQEFSKESEEVVKSCELLEEELVKARNELSRIPAKHRMLDKLWGFRNTLQKDYSTLRTRTWIGSIQLVSEESFLSEVSKETNLLDLQILSRDKQKIYFRLTVLEELLGVMVEKLNTFQFEELDIMSELGDYIGKGLDEIRLDLERKEKKLVMQMVDIEKRAKELANHVNDLKVLYDYNLWKKKKQDFQQKMYKSEYLFAFEAWLPVSEYAKLEKWLQNTFIGEVEIEKIAKEKEEEEPVLLKNFKGVSTYEPIVSMYGLPKKKELDPTIFVMPFFTIFFGICLSDVGYGSILTAFAAWLIIFGKFSKAAKESLLILLFCGISAIIGGVLLGGYFGMSPDQAPAFLTEMGLNDAGKEVLKFKLQALNPMDGVGPIIFLGIALGLGVFQILFGITLDFIIKLKNKAYMDAFCDPAAWFFLLVMLMLYGTADMIGLSKDLFGKLSLLGAGILILTQGRDQKNWLLKPIFGLLGLYNITAYLSDLLSYSRIMALGLATGVVGFAMNMTAGIISDMIPIPFLGFLVGIAVLLFGHTLNFALSTLGAFIHSGRLQFIEFFGKFYEGGGREFKPFKRENVYISFKE